MGREANRNLFLFQRNPAVRNSITTIAFLLLTNCLFAQEISTDELSSLLNANAEIYSGDIDVEMVSHFETRQEGITPVEVQSGMTIRSYQSFSTQTRYVYQGDKFYMGKEQKSRFFASDKKEYEDLPLKETSADQIQFNGSKTTLLQKNSYANIFGYRNDAMNKEFPFNLLLNYSFFKHGDLAVVTRGYEYASSDPQNGSTSPRYYECRAFEQDSDELNEYIKLEFDFYTNDDPSSPKGSIVEVLYLNVNKNYIPEKYEMYDARFKDGKKACIVGEVTSWSEAKPGIWYPQRAEIKNYVKAGRPDDTDIYDEWISKMEFTVNKVDFNPQYEDAYFSQIQIPDGIAVYEIEEPVAEGESTSVVSRSYRKGAPNDPTFKASGSASSLVSFLASPRVILNLLVVMGLVFYISRKRKSA